MQATSDIIAKNIEYPVDLMYPLLYASQRNDEARTADWCAALSDGMSSVEVTGPQSEQSDHDQQSSHELIYDQYDLALSPYFSLQALTRYVRSGSFDPIIAKPEENGLLPTFIDPMPAPQIGFLTLPEPNFLTSSPMQSMSGYGAPLHTFPSAFPPPAPLAFNSGMFSLPATCYNNNTPAAVSELSGHQHFSPAPHHNHSHEPSAYGPPHAGSTSNWRGSSAPNSIMSAPPPPVPPTLQTPSPITVVGGAGHMFRCAKEQLEFDISQHRLPQQPPCITDAMKVWVLFPMRARVIREKTWRNIWLMPGPENHMGISGIANFSRLFGVRGRSIIVGRVRDRRVYGHNRDGGFGNMCSFYTAIHGQRYAGSYEDWCSHR